MGIKMETRKAVSKMCGEVREIKHQKKVKKWELKRKELERFALESVGKPEKAFTRNETFQPIKIGHMAKLHATPPRSN